MQFENTWAQNPKKFNNLRWLQNCGDVMRPGVACCVFSPASPVLE